MAQAQAQLESLTQADLPALYNVLMNTLSNDTNIRKPAEDFLHTKLENRPGFCSLLYEFIINKTADINIRWIAVLCFKNVINRYWRRQAAGGVPDEEKNALRSKLLKLLNEENRMLGIHIALLFAKIARLDFPQQWPDLFSSLVNIIQTGTELEKLRGLAVLHHVIKELASKRLIQDKKNFMEVSQQLLPFMCQVWSFHVKNINELLYVTPSPIFQDMQKYMSLLASAEASSFCAKALRRIIMFGIPDFNKNSDALTFMTLLIEEIKKIVAFRAQLVKAGNSSEHLTSLLAALDKCALRFSKVLLHVQLKQPIPFAGLLPQYLPFVYSQITSSASSEDIFGQFIVHCMLFIKNVSSCREYDNSGSVREKTSATNESIEAARKLVHESFFTRELLGELCVTLIFKYMILTEDELDEWESDPESFMVEQEMDNWTEAVKPCAETLFMELLETHREKVAPFVVGLLQEKLRGLANSNDVKSSSLVKDSCYNAIGLAAFELYDYIDFNAWYMHQLRGEIESQSNEITKIPRKRATWLVGRWVEKINRETRAVVYQSLLAVLNDSDIVLKITALQALQSVMDDFDFNKEDFERFLEPYISHIFNLLPIVRSTEIKLKVINALSLVIERMEDKIIPFSGKLMEWLPALWTSAGNENLIKSAIIIASTKFVQTLGSDSVHLYHFLLPLIQYSTDTEQPEKLYFMEDGLELWHNVVQNAQSMPVELLKLFNNVIKISDSGDVENLHTILKITDSYVLLGKADFMNVYAAQLSKMFLQIIGNVKERPTLYCIDVMDTLLLLFPKEAPLVLDQPLQKALSEIFNGKETDLIISNYISLFARLALQNQGFFMQLFQRLQQQSNQNDLLYKFIDTWLDKADFLVSSLKRKLTALALIALLPTRDPQILQRLGLIINLCVAVLHEDSSLSAEYEPLSEPDEDDFVDTTQRPRRMDDTQRKNDLRQTDPVLTLDLHSFLMDRLNKTAELLGPDVFQQLIAQHVDPAVLQQFQTLKQNQQQKKQQ